MKNLLTPEIRPGREIMTLLISAAVVFPVACKNHPDSATADGDEDREKKSSSALRLSGDEPVAPPMSPFSNSEKDLYVMSRNELQRVPPADLLKEIEILERRNENEKKELVQLGNLNLIFCKRLAKMQSECVAHQFISNDHGLSGLNCTGNDPAKATPPAEIRVEIVGGGDNAYILLADSVYVSDEFTTGTTGAISFKRKDNKIVRPPRFRDLESLNVISIKPGSAEIVDGRLSFNKEKIPPLENFSIKISVNGQQLMSEFPLVKPDDPHDDWYYRINPNGIMTLGRSPACTVTLKEIRELQERSKG